VLHRGRRLSAPRRVLGTAGGSRFGLALEIVVENGRPKKDPEWRCGVRTKLLQCCGEGQW
jgi:hypothetical protein